MRFTLFATFILSLLLLRPLPANAAISPTLSISPARYDLTVIPGQIQQETVTITNKSNVAVPIKVAVMDFSPKDEHGGINFGTSLPNHSAVSWLQTSKKDLLLKPGETAPVTVTMSPPDVITPGSYFAVVMFQSQLPSNYFDASTGSQAEIVPWIGTLFLLKTETAPTLDSNALTITHFNLPKVTAKSSIPASIEVTNNTNYHLEPETHFKLKSIFGSVDATVDNPGTTILPGQSRIFTASIKRPSLLGLYRGVAALKIADWQTSSTSSLLYLMTIPGLLLLLASGLILTHGFRGRKRLIRAWQVLTRR